MKVRTGYLLATATSALTIVVGSILSPAIAQTAMNAPAVMDNWWSQGYIELGGRFFLNNPQRDGMNRGGGDSLAKFYKYQDLRPGPFGNIGVKAGTKDGVYGFGFWADNIGYDDQSYSLSLSKTGQHYLDLGWDQTPNLASTSAQTIYGGVGSNSLTISAALRKSIYDAAVAGNYNAGGPPTVLSLINGNLHKTDIGIRRDTGSVAYRYTPTDNWDFGANYSHLHRTGTQAQGVIFNNSSGGMFVEAPQPVNDTTQNFGANGEYAGTSPWGKKFNWKLAYNGSVFSGDKSYDLDNPYFDPAAAGTRRDLAGNVCANVLVRGVTSYQCLPTSARMSLWPDNNAHGFSSTLGAELPAKSRYMGTATYTMMRQNDSFLPFTSNPNLGAAPINGQNPSSLAALPYASLDGKIDTFLSNNVVTTQITHDLKSKLTYRYYDYHNETADQLYARWVGTDFAVYAANQGTYTTKRAIGGSYTKQNLAEELTWRPFKWLSTGAEYGWERTSWSHNDADYTTDNSGKVFADVTFASWIRSRASWKYSERRYGTYTNTIAAGGPNGNTVWNVAYRSAELANLDQNKGKIQVDFDIVPSKFTISPFAGLQYRNYRTDAFGAARELGVLKDNSSNIGVEAAMAPAAGTNIVLSYTHEVSEKRIVGGGGTPAAPSAMWDSNVNDKVDTIQASLKQVIIPDKLDLKLGYTYSISSGAFLTSPLFYNGYVVGGTLDPTYPDTRTMFQRFDALFTYKIDDSVVRRMGWLGKAELKARYAWERNRVVDWRIDGMLPYLNYAGTPYGSQSTMMWLAGDNPNYNVQLMALALSLKW